MSQPFKEVIRTNILGMPGSLFILLFLVVAWLIFKRTRLGIALYAVGSNEKGAILSGSNTVRVNIYGICPLWLFCGDGGLVSDGAGGFGLSPVAGDGLIFSSIAAVVIGGTSLAGGRGGVELEHHRRVDYAVYQRPDFLCRTSAHFIRP